MTPVSASAFDGAIAKPDPSDANRKIVWLASYPKSGNTWTRILLSNLLANGDGWNDDDMKINLAGSIASNRPRFDNLTGLPSSDLTDEEIDLLRPSLFQEIARQTKDKLFVKVHDAYHQNADAKPIFPTDVSIGAIYLVRNPMDVAVSYSYHQGHDDFAKVVKQMGLRGKSLAGGDKSQLRQKMFDWSGHYQSWMRQKAIPVLCIRYEDMLGDTVGMLTKMATFLGLEQANNGELVEAAVEQSRFERLQEKEKTSGFLEKPQKAKQFFRSGRAGEGRENLSIDLQRRICEDHFETMIEQGYLAEDDHPST